MLKFLRESPVFDTVVKVGIVVIVLIFVGVVVSGVVSDSVDYDGHYWGSAPDGIYDIFYDFVVPDNSTVDDIVFDSLTFELCPHGYNVLHGEWLVRDGVKLPDSAEFHVYSGYAYGFYGNHTWVYGKCWAILVNNVIIDLVEF